MARFDGFKEALELLAKMDTKGRERILHDMAKQDPDMAEALRKNMVTFEDLIHLTPQMLSKLLQEVDLQDVALGLRTSSDELKNFFLSNVSIGRQKDMEEILMGPPQSVSKVDEAIENVMAVVRDKVEKGEFVIDPEGGEYV